MGVCKKYTRSILAREYICDQRCSDTSEHAAYPRFTEDQRKELLEGYCGKNVFTKMYASSMVTSHPAKRIRKTHGAILESQRQHTFRYQFKVNGIMIPVCKKFILGTWNMKEWSMKYWSKKAVATNTAAPVHKVATPARSPGVV